MAFSLDDMLVNMGLDVTRGLPRGRECYREEAASMSFKPEDLKALFPNVQLSDSKEVVYAPFRLCHSLPKVNLRGRGFTARTLANSFGSVRDGTINVDHQMFHRQGTKDTICGHMVCGRFDPYGQYKDEVASAQKIPAEPIPLMALAAFYGRSQYVPAFLKEHSTGKRKWMTSMECSHNWEQASFYYRGEFIPLKDAEQGMRECVGKLSVKPYKNHDLALLLGGECGNVDFHAAAITPEPADDGADILAFVTRQDQASEAANRGGNPFFFPLEIYRGSSQAASQPVQESDETITEDELANIAILGKTEPGGDDKHVHEVLSDGTIIPMNGHTHYLRAWSLARGTTPRLTGHTDTHYDYFRDASQRELSKVHMHMLNVKLRGSTEESPAADPMADAASITDPFFPAIPCEPFLASDPNWELSMTASANSLEGLFGRLNTVLSSGKFEGAAAQEVASLRQELARTAQGTIVKELVAQEIANQMKEGVILSKADAEKLRDEAVKVATEKAAAEATAAAARTTRREKVLALGLDLDTKFNEKTQLTVGEYVDTFGLDANGEKGFQVAYATLEAIKSQQDEKAEAEAAAAAAAAAVAGVTTPVADTPAPTTGTEVVAANKGKKPVVPKPVAKPAAKMLLVGGGGADEEAGAGEGNAAAGSPAKPAAKPAKPQGRHMFKTAL